MKSFLQSWPAEAEMAVVSFLCFGYFIFGSTFAMLMPRAELVFTNADALGLILLELMAASAALVVLYARGWKIAQWDMRPTGNLTMAGLALMIVYYLLYCIAVSVLIAISGTRAPFELDFRSTAWFVVIVPMSIVNGYFEELFAGVYVIETLEPKHGAAFAISASTLLRLLYHTYQGPVAVASILPMGLLFGAVYAKWRKAWPLIFAHIVLDIWALSSSNG